MFETLTLEGALYIAQHTRGINLNTFRECVPEVSPETFAINRWKSEGAAWQMIQDGVPVAMGGIEMVAPWLGVAWMSVTDQMSDQSWKKLIRFSRRVFENASKTIPRIEAHCYEGWGMAQKYLKALGFQYEFTRARAAKDGRGVVSFVIFGGVSE